MRTLVALVLSVLTVVVVLLAVPGGGAAAEKLTGKPVIAWSRTGGIAGLRQTMRIGLDRRIVAFANGRRIEARLPRKRYRALRRLLEQAHLESIPARNPNPGAADTFRYTVGYRGRTVAADETRVPERLQKALRALWYVWDDLEHDRLRLVDAQHADLAAARARWRRAKLHGDYRFRLRVSCFCPEAGVERTIRVRDGKPHGGRYADLSVDTVPEMFRLIARALDDPDAGDVDVRYDDALGYPRRASVDRIEAAIDDEISWTARGLRATR